MEEISGLKIQIASLENIVEARDKEIKYLKRAMESVYSRFQSSLNDAQNHNIEQSLLQDDIASKTLKVLADREDEVQVLRKQLLQLQSEIESKSANPSVISIATVDDSVLEITGTPELVYPTHSPPPPRVA